MKEKEIVVFCSIQDIRLGYIASYIDDERVRIVQLGKKQPVVRKIKNVVALSDLIKKRDLYYGTKRK